jgi:hypothetical protein
VDVDYERIKNHRPDLPRTELLAQILRKFEEAGDAMRFLNSDGKIAWKGTPRMLTRLADAEQEAIDDMEECPCASGDMTENLVFRGIRASCNDAIALTSNTSN